MESQSPESALARIDAALARIEAAANRARPLSDADLAARHDALRAAVGQTLGQIDALISEQEA